MVVVILKLPASVPGDGSPAIPSRFPGDAPAGLHQEVSPCPSTLVAMAIGTALNAVPIMWGTMQRLGPGSRHQGRSMARGGLVPHVAWGNPMVHM